MAFIEEVVDFLSRYGERNVVERISDPVVLSHAAHLMASRERPNRKVMRPCEYCGELFGFKDLRKHMPHCPERKKK